MLTIASPDKSVSCEVYIKDAHKLVSSTEWDVSPLIDCGDKWVFCISLPYEIQSIEFRGCVTFKE